MTRFRRWTTWIVIAAMIAIALAPWTAHAAVSGRAAIVLDLKDVRAVGAETGTVAIQQTFEWLISNGTGDGQAQQCYQGVRTLATGANEDLDVAGSLANLYGVTVFTKVKLVAFFAARANTTNVTISRPAANGLLLFAAASDALAALKPGGGFAFWDPSSAAIAVTAGTADLVNVANSAGATATYTVVICGLQ